MIAQILQYYAIILLVSSPVTAVLLVVIYKKTDYIERFDAWLDAVLGLGRKEDEARDAEDRAAENGERASREADALKNGVTTIRLSIGQSYWCHQSVMWRRSGAFRLRWYPENGFIGEMDEDGLFTARRAGTTKIFCEVAGAGEDVAQHVYNMEVAPGDPQWLPGILADMLEKAAGREAVMAGQYRRRLLSAEDGRCLLRYGGTPSDAGLRFQFGADGRLLRCALFLKKSPEGDAGWDAAFDERFEKAELERGRGPVWMHKKEQDGDVEVDMYAILARMPDGREVFCMGRAWREYEDELEFLKNLMLAQRLFSELVPEICVEDMRAVIHAEAVPAATPDPSAGQDGDGDAQDHADGDVQDLELASAVLAGQVAANGQNASEGGEHAREAGKEPRGDESPAPLPGPGDGDGSPAQGGTPGESPDAGPEESPLDENQADFTEYYNSEPDMDDTI